MVSVSFSMATFSFDEGSGTGSVTIVKNAATNFPFDIRVTGGSCCIYSLEIVNYITCTQSPAVRVYVLTQVPVHRLASR